MSSLPTVRKYTGSEAPDMYSTPKFTLMVFRYT